MGPYTFALWLLLAFFAGSLAMLGLFVLADWHIRRRHHLVTEDQVDAALSAYRGGAS